MIAIAETENFQIKVESDPLKIARVMVGLCQIKPEIAEILRAEFYRTCPLTVPRQPEPGLTGIAFRENMGFKDKERRADAQPDDTSHEETNKVWLDRMKNILATFAVLVTLSDPGGPFTLVDGWAWLANMINACSRIATPHFFTR